MQNRGLASGKGFFGRLWGKVKSRSAVLVGALVTGNFGVAAAVVLTSIAEVTFGFDMPDLGLWSPNVNNVESDYEPTQSEQIVLEKWNDENFIPFFNKIESLMIGTNEDKNKALILMAIYEAALTKQIAEKNYPMRLSEKATVYRLAFVQTIFADVRATLTVEPSVSKTETTANWISQMSEVSSDLNLVPASVEVKTLSTKSLPVDVDLNLPHIKDDRDLTVRTEKDTKEVSVKIDTGEVVKETKKPSPQVKEERKSNGLKILGGVAVFGGLLLMVNKLTGRKF